MKPTKSLLLSFCVLWITVLPPLANAGVLFTNLVFFSYTNAPNYGWNIEFGAGHGGALVQGADGDFYGVTCKGGTVYESDTSPPIYGFGTLFKLTPDGAFTSLHSFGDVSGDGREPLGNLVRAADGNIYGITPNGGSLPTSDEGTIYRISTNGVYTSLYSFGHELAGSDELHKVYTNTDGGVPYAGIVQGSDGNFYGTTSTLGARDGGTVFQFKPDGTLNTLFTFPYLSDASYATNGNGPFSELVEGDDGTFYGTTYWGGANGAGTVFRITSTGALTTLVSFDVRNGYPTSGLTKGAGGLIYGSTGSSIYQVTTNGQLTTLNSFILGPSGLILGSDGNLYGTTAGDSYNHGTVFQMKPDGTMTTLYSFGGPDGSTPSGPLVQGKDGYFYGTTTYGGPQWTGSAGFSGYGTIFRVAILPSFQSIKQIGGDINLTLIVMPGQKYLLQYCTDLAATDWHNLGDPVTAGNPVPSVLDHLGTDSLRYYRIELLQ